MKRIQRVTVYCGSSVGARAEYAQACREMGRTLTERGIEMVYGGGGIGLMGLIADAVLDSGGKVVGVIPQMLVEKELSHRKLTELVIVDSMHVRKQKMIDLGDAFVALPGGVGTMDEMFEVFTLQQLGIHRKPLGLLNTLGYYDGLIAFLDRMVAEGFLKLAQREQLIVEESPAKLLERFESFKYVDIFKVG